LLWSFVSKEKVLKRKSELCQFANGALTAAERALRGAGTSIAEKGTFIAAA
jgi:hypothetical protein